MRSLRNRLRRLQRGYGGAGCAGCGHVPGGRVEFVVAEQPSREGPRSCPACGCPLWFTFDLGAASGREGSA